MALYEDESCGLARVASDDRIVRGLRVSGKRCQLAEPASPRIPAASGEQQGGTCGEFCNGERVRCR